MKSIKLLKSFLERIVDFDYEERYTREVRFFFHLTIWIIYALLYFPYIYLGYEYTFAESLIMTFRMIILNMIVFYLFFYVAVPNLLRKDYIFLFIISLILLLQLYLVLNRIFYGLVLKLDFPIESTLMVNLMERVKNSTVWDAFSFRSILVRAFDVVLILSPLFFIKMVFDLTRTYAKSVRANRKIEELKTENLKMENKFLNAQLNPHFLFNTLNNLYGLALKKDDLAPELILKLSEIMRYTLYEANVNYISLIKEIQFIEDYVGLEKMRFNQDIRLFNNISNKDIRNLKIAPLLPFVFLENAFKYGLRSEQPFLKVQLSLIDNKFIFEIKNDFLAIGSGSHKSGGIGLENVKKRLDLIYPEKHVLTIKKDKNSYLVNLIIDLSTDE